MNCIFGIMNVVDSKYANNNNNEISLHLESVLNNFNLEIVIELINRLISLIN